MRWIEWLHRKGESAATNVGDGRENILAGYVTKAPQPQNALDIFAGEWLSKFPPPFDQLTAGYALLFEDARLQWAIDRLGGASGKRVLELGPLEGGHTYLLDRAGAADVLAIEANMRAYLKCLIAKEVLGMRSARFACGDFSEYLRTTTDRVDIVIASGILYHMINPVELVAKIAAVTDAVYLWTHYYDEALFNGTPAFAHRVVAPETSDHEGYQHVLHRNEYRSALERMDFCGGAQSHSNWLTRDGVLGALRYFGLGKIEINYEQTDHANGPAFSVLAQR